MAKTYFLGKATSDLTMGGLFTHKLLPAVGSLDTDNIIAASGGGVDEGWYVEDDATITRVDGAMSTEVDVVTGVADTLMAVQWHRINAAGVVQASSGFTGTQASTSAGLLNFSDATPGLGTFLSDDRLGVEIQVTNNAAHGGAKGPTHNLETTNCETVTPFTTPAPSGDVHIRIGGAWKVATMWIRIGGVWKAVTSTWIKIAGAWKEIP